MATRAASLAKIVGNKWVKDKSEITGKHGIVFFDTITGSKVTSHISLWDGDKVVDADYFDKSARVYFLRFLEKREGAMRDGYGMVGNPLVRIG